MPEPPASRTPGAGRVAGGGAGKGGFAVTHLAEVDSTNRYALDAARAGAPDRTVVVADVQRAGRGRLGRSWVAPAGASLLVSVVLRRRGPAAALGRLTMATALAMADAITAVTGGVVPELKWPNDLLVDGRKLAGILAEAERAAPPRAEREHGHEHGHRDGGEDDATWNVVVGVGVNVAWDAFPPELVDIATALNLVSDQTVERDALLDAFLECLDARLGALDRVARDYAARLATLGRRVRVELAQEVFEGVATEVDDDGVLHVTRDDGTTTTVGAADVVHLR